MIKVRMTQRPAWIAILLGSLAVGLTTLYFSLRESTMADLGRPVRYLVAAREIPPLVELTPAMLAWREVPRQFASPGILTTLSDIVGLVTQGPFAAGEPITRMRLRPRGNGHGFATMIPGGMRAVAMAVDPVSGVASLIEPGNWVDVLATFDFGEAATAQSFTMTLFDHVLVLAVDQRMGPAMDNGSPRPAGEGVGAVAHPRDATITLALLPDQAQRFIFAQENGHVRLTVRPQEELEIAGPATPREPATAASVTGMPSLVRRKEYRGR